MDDHGGGGGSRNLRKCHTDRMVFFGGPGRFMRTSLAVQQSYIHAARRPSVIMQGGGHLGLSPIQAASALHPDGVTASDLAQLLAVLLSAVERQAAAEDLADEVQTKTPIFAELAAYLSTGAGQSDLIKWLITTLIAILALVKTSVSSPVPAPPVVVNVQVNQPSVPTKNEIANILEQKLNELEQNEPPTIGQARS